MAKVVGAVAMSLVVVSGSQCWAQQAVVAPAGPLGPGIVTQTKTTTKVTHEVGAPEPVAVGAPAEHMVQLEKGQSVVRMTAPAPVMANPTPRGMGVPVFPAPSVSASAGIAAPYGQGLAAAAPVGTPYLRSPAFAGPPIIYMPQTVTRVLLPGATPYPSNIMSPPSNYTYASAPFIRTDIYTSLPYGTFYWPQGYAGTTPVEPQVPAYVTAPAAAILTGEASYTAGRYDPNVAHAETLNPIISGVNSNLVSTTGLGENGVSASVSGVVPVSPITPQLSVQVEDPAVVTIPTTEVVVAPVVTPAAVEPFPVLSDGTSANPNIPVIPAGPTPTPAPVVNGVPELPALPDSAPAPALPELPSAVPASPAAPAGMPALPPAPANEVSMALPTLPAEAVAAPAGAMPSLPTPATPAAPATMVLVDDKVPGALTLEPAGAWTPSANSTESHEGSSMIAKVVPGQVAKATFNASVPADGQYEVALWYVGGTPQFRSASVPVTVNTATGPQQATIDQTKGGQWTVIGTYALKAGQNVPVVTISTEGMTPQGDAISVSADALRLTPQ